MLIVCALQPTIKTPNNIQDDEKANDNHKSTDK